MQSPADPPAQHLIRAETAQRVRSAMREAQNETERLLLDLVDRRRTSDAASSPGNAAMHDAVELLLLVRFELAVLMEDLAHSRGSLRANFYGRLLLSTVYESALSLRCLLGCSFREAVSASSRPELETDLRAVHARIQCLAHRCIEEYGEIRDGVIAHRDQTPERRLRLLEQVGGGHVLDLALELSQAITEILQMMLGLLEPQASRRRKLLPVAGQA